MIKERKSVTKGDFVELKNEKMFISCRFANKEEQESIAKAMVNESANLVKNVNKFFHTNILAKDTNDDKIDLYQNAMKFTMLVFEMNDDYKIVQTFELDGMLHKPTQKKTLTIINSQYILTNDNKRIYSLRVDLEEMYASLQNNIEDIDICVCIYDADKINL